MRFFEAEALLLDVAPLGDHDRALAFLTRDWGLKRGSARGARRRYSRFAGQLQPLAKVRVRWFEKEGRELARVTDLELLRARRHLLEDLEGILIGSYLAESVREFASENEPAEKLFRLLDSTVEALEGGVERGLAARYLETWVLRLAGIFPAPTACPRCGGSLAAAARLVGGGESLVCESCASAEGGGQPVSGAALEFLRRSAREALPAMAAAPVAAAVLGEVERVAGAVRRHFLQHELRSYGVMERTLAGVRGG